MTDLCADREFDTRCPVIRSGPASVATIIDISLGEGIRRVLAFDAEISWIRETTATWTILDPAGAAICSGSEYTDFYGLATSLKEPIEVAFARASTLAAGPGSAIEVAVTIRVRDVPAIPTGQTGVFKGMRFRHLPQGWLDGMALPEIENWLAMPWPRRVESGFHLPVIKADERPVVAWSSRDSGDAVLRRRAAVVLAILDGLPDNDHAALEHVIGNAYAAVTPALAIADGGGS